MARRNKNPSLDNRRTPPNAAFSPRQTGRWIALGLVLGVVCGLLLGEYCRPLEVVGQAYVGLLQMTVLPYLMFSLIGKLGRLDMDQAKSLGLTALGVLLLLLLLGIVLVVIVSLFFPAISGAAFFSPPQQQLPTAQQDFVATFIPSNIFHSLSSEWVPAVIVFCFFFGSALMHVPNKGSLLTILDICSESIGRINVFLVRLAPLGLFALTAAAAGTLRFEELSRLQGYLILFTLACLWMAFGLLPLMLCSLTDIRYRDLLRAAQEPLLTAIATGKLFLVLPQVVGKCEELLQETSPSGEQESTVSVLVPMAYPFPHVGKVLAFVFVSFSAWYAGNALSPAETAVMAATGTASSFASPLVTMPYLLDKYQLPQDLMLFFILPGFITMRLGDVVGVMHLMVLTLVTNAILRGRSRIKWPRLLVGTLGLLAALIIAGWGSRWYLDSTKLDYDLDQRLLALQIPDPYHDVIVYRSREEIPSRPPLEGSTIERVKQHVLRVGYHPDHLPYSFFNSQGQLVGLDVELMHRLAKRIQVRLEFVPYQYDTIADQLAGGEIDLAVGGLIMKPERLLQAEFTQPYQTATVAVLLADHLRGQFDQWNDPQAPPNLRLGVVHEDLAAAARRQLPDVEILVIPSLSAFFTKHHRNLDGLILAAEEGAAWNVLYPEYTVVVPKPAVQRPVGMAVHASDGDWIRFLDRWLDFERLDGTLDRLRSYWIEGGGTEQRSPRWSILQNVLHWLP